MKIILRMVEKKMENVYSLVLDHRKNNPDAILEILNRFDPLLNKLQRNSYYEDMKSELIVFMFNLIDKIPIENENLKKDKYIVSYIHKALKNQYIHINKKHAKGRNTEVSSEEFYIDNCLGFSYHDDLFTFIHFEEMISHLTELEKKIIEKKYKHGYSNSDRANSRNISRQAVYKTHKRAIEKIKNKFRMNSLAF